MYLAAAKDVSDQVDPVEWWKAHAGVLKNWAKASRLVILVQPSSATAERVFSILSQPFFATTGITITRRLYSVISTNNSNILCSYMHVNCADHQQ